LGITKGKWAFLLSNDDSSLIAVRAAAGEIASRTARNESRKAVERLSVRGRL